MKVLLQCIKSETISDIKKKTYGYQRGKVRMEERGQIN